MDIAAEKLQALTTESEIGKNEQCLLITYCSVKVLCLRRGSMLK